MRGPAHERYVWRYHRHPARTKKAVQRKAAPIQKRKLAKLPKPCLARPVTGYIMQITSSPHYMWRACARGRTPRTLGNRETLDRFSVDILAVSSSHTQNTSFVGFCRCDVCPTLQHDDERRGTVMQSRLYARTSKCTFVRTIHVVYLTFYFHI